MALAQRLPLILTLASMLFAGTLGLIAAAPTRALDKRPEQAPEAPTLSAEPMDNDRLGELLERLDAEVQGQAGQWLITYTDIPIYVVTDERADRMRIMTPIIDAETVSQALLYRLLQANFDAALDARYAIAQDKVWSTFLHPLSSLTERDFFSGLAQTLVARNTFGTSFSSGALTFGGGDSQEEQRQLYEQIMKDGQAL